MQVDRVTFADLSVFDAGEEGGTLLALLDRTRSRMGSLSLLARMRELPRGSDLQRTQDAIRALSAAGAPIHQAILRANPDAVDAYLALKWQGLTKRGGVARFIERVTLRARYRDAVRDISRGSQSLEALVGGLPDLVNRLSPGPELLRDYSIRLSRLSESPPIEEVRRYASARSLGRVLELDRLARGDARGALREILVMLAQLDALCALASATTEYGWSFPRIVEDHGVVEITGLRHAMLPRGVANDVLLDGSQRVLAITGPNMAGKSTLLKAMGLAVYLTHLGCGIPAVRARVSRFDALLASLNVRDSLASGQSFYLSEVRRIKQLVSLLESNPRVFAVIDEPFKGTNLHDATDATSLLVDGMCAQLNSTVVVATHMADVVRSRVSDTSLATSYLSAAASDHGPLFDYQLRSGVSDQRLGMVLLEREGVTPALTAAIRQRAQRLEKRG
jgi:DNA mismatch repair ATPase MutS